MCFKNYNNPRSQSKLIPGSCLVKLFLIVIYIQCFSTRGMLNYSVNQPGRNDGIIVGLTTLRLTDFLDKGIIICNKIICFNCFPLLIGLIMNSLMKSWHHGRLGHMLELDSLFQMRNLKCKYYRSIEVILCPLSMPYSQNSLLFSFFQTFYFKRKIFCNHKKRQHTVCLIKPF